MILECSYLDEPHEHTFPDDWIFAGDNDADPRADPRWRPTTYVYFDQKLRPIWHTQTPLCDHQALDEFTKVTQFGPTFQPMLIEKHEPGKKSIFLPYQYDPATDTISDWR